MPRRGERVGRAGVDHDFGDPVAAEADDLRVRRAGRLAVARCVALEADQHAVAVQDAHVEQLGRNSATDRLGHPGQRLPATAAAATRITTGSVPADVLGEEAAHGSDVAIQDGCVCLLDRLDVIGAARLGLMCHHGRIMFAI